MSSHRTIKASASILALTVTLVLAYPIHLLVVPHRLCSTHGVLHHGTICPYSPSHHSHGDEDSQGGSHGESHGSGLCLYSVLFATMELPQPDVLSLLPPPWVPLPRPDRARDQGYEHFEPLMVAPKLSPPL